jgi:ABC-2 type transport system ATP-binding protein
MSADRGEPVASSELAIEASGLEKSFGTLKVLVGVDLRVEPGSVYALLGPNGAGKTTTVRILATLSRPDSGRALVMGSDVVRNRHRVRRVISLTGQFASIDQLQTGEENLQMLSRLAGHSRSSARQRAGELLERFELTEAARRRVATYSGGMRRRLDLAASLVGRPRVVFLDEPTTGLDIRSRQAMWAVIGDLAREGVTVFLTTQYLEEADRLADRVAVIDGGLIVAEGTPRELKQRVGGRRLDLVLSGPDAFDRVAQILGERAIRMDPSALTIGVPTEGLARPVRNVLDEVDSQRVDVKTFAVHDVTLDDVFLALTGNGVERDRQEVSRV